MSSNIMVHDGCAIAAWFRLGVYGNMHMVQAGCAMAAWCRLGVHGCMVQAGCARELILYPLAAPPYLGSELAQFCSPTHPVQAAMPLCLPPVI